MRTDREIAEEGESKFGIPSFAELAKLDPDWARETRRSALDDDDIDDLIESICADDISCLLVFRLSRTIERHCDLCLVDKWEKLTDEEKASFYGSR